MKTQNQQSKKRNCLRSRLAFPVPRLSVQRGLTALLAALTVVGNMHPATADTFSPSILKQVQAGPPSQRAEVLAKLVALATPASSSSSWLPKGRENQQALLALALIENGAGATGLQYLFRIQSPKRIDAELRGAIRSALQNQDRLILESQPLSLWPTFWRESLQETPFVKNTQKFQRALRSAAYNQTRLATIELRDLVTVPQSTIPRDQIALASARVLYQDKAYAEALLAYSQVDKASDYWLEAIEEKAWTYAQLGQVNEALAQLRTLLSEPFAANVGVDPYFLNGYVNLKVCNYENVFNTTRLFRHHMTRRLNDMQALVEAKGASEAARQAISKMALLPTDWKRTGANVSSLPRLFHRDTAISSALLRQHLITREQQTLRALTGPNNSGPAGLPEPTSGLWLYKRMDHILAQSQILTFGRLKSLAEKEAREIRRIIPQLHIVEAEAIQRMKLVRKDRPIAKNVSPKASDSEDDLSFGEVSGEIGNQETWIDEADSYQVSASRCPEFKGGQKL